LSGRDVPDELIIEQPGFRLALHRTAGELA